VTARLLLHTIRREVLGEEVTQAEMATRYAEYFPTFIGQGVKAQLLDGSSIRTISSAWARR
jgi:ribonucleoside-diphosphate reductase alpha chain